MFFKYITTRKRNATTVISILSTVSVLLSVIFFLLDHQAKIQTEVFHQIRLLLGWWRKTQANISISAITSSPSTATATATAALVILLTSIALGVFSSNKLSKLAQGFGLRGLGLGLGNTTSIMQRYVGGATSRFRTKRTREYRFAMKNGGELGGISNDGNTCFMNSVIQSLASSTQLLKFIDGYLYTEIELEGGDVVKSNQAKLGLEFTTALRQLLDGVNGSYGTRGKEFSTKNLLSNMPNGPKQNFFSGYNQEDAQEFYQLVFRILEKEYKKVTDGGNSDADSTNSSSSSSDGNNNEKETGDGLVARKNITDFVYGLQNIGFIGKVYVPGAQVDPNLNEDGNSPDDKKYLPLNLITPVDGITVERVGCLKCGEHGGIRYAVNSGLSLNLPNRNVFSFSIYELLNDWITPDIIEDVNCNRCGLVQTREFLEQKVSDSQQQDADAAKGKLTSMYTKRIEEIDLQLQKNYISDEVFDKLTIKQMIKKTKKSKQILFSRPSPLLCMHINRSVFDPRTYSIVKNSANVTFPVKLNLANYTADSDHINSDARLPLRKEVEGEEVNIIYSLKAAISHYGTHNYGHYICYRKLRGTWWRISDESVYVVTEDEVTNSQGTFMLFYEFDDGTVEDLQELTDDEEEEDDEEEGGDASDMAKGDDEEEDASMKSEDDSEPKKVRVRVNRRIHAERESESESDSDSDLGVGRKRKSSPSSNSVQTNASETEELSDTKKGDYDEYEEVDTQIDDPFNTEESRAFHI